MSLATPEFSRPVRIDTLGSAPRPIAIEANQAERAALARRFSLVAIDRLDAKLGLVRAGDIVTATGELAATVTQSCVASGEPVAAVVQTSFEIQFKPTPQDRPVNDEGIELSAAECDVVFFSGGEVDIGEAVAETLALNIDPWPRAGNADAALRQAGVKREEEVGPFAALAELRDKMDPDDK